MRASSADIEAAVSLDRRRFRLDGDAKPAPVRNLFEVAGKSGGVQGNPVRGVRPDVAEFGKETSPRLV